MKERRAGWLKFYTKYMAVWVMLFSGAAYFRPAPFIALRPFLDHFFSLTMFGIGAVLHAGDFKRVAGAPLAVAIGAAAQFTLMPVGAFLLAGILGLPPLIALGLILTGSAPGAMASNVLSYIAKADVAYSVSLTAVSTLLTPLLTPGLTYLLAGSVIEVDFYAMFLSVVTMVIIPLLLGFAVRHFFRKKIERALDIFPAISVTFIVFICALVVALNRSHLGRITGPVLLAVVLLNVWGMFSGYGTGKIAGFAPERKRALSIEIGMQNAGLGTVLALKHFGPEAAVPAAAFVLVCIFTASIMAEFWRGKATVPEKLSSLKA
ncbi:MAG: bile acid:sodium symporter family protein [Candidatus Omnitrophica bacterium]|nr:bile acid:sodium symporter family protein [Candidatus Omnitrophota bacterium]